MGCQQAAPAGLADGGSCHLAAIKTTNTNKTATMLCCSQRNRMRRINQAITARSTAGFQRPDTLVPSVPAPAM